MSRYRSRQMQRFALSAGTSYFSHTSRYRRRRRLQLFLVIGLAVAMILPLAAGILFSILS